MEISFRSFDRTRDYNSQRSLFGLSFPETIGTPSISKQHYDWKFGSFPAEEGFEHSYQYVASDSSVVGYYAALPYPYKVAGRDIKAGMVCDVMTHPARRGGGIFTKIGAYATNDLAKQGIAFTTGYPIRPEVIPGHLKVGWKIVLKLPMYLRPLSSKFILPRQASFLAKIIDPFITAIQAISLVPNKDFESKILSREDFLKLPSYDDFFAKWLSSHSHALLKTKDFLAWRTGAPGTEYSFIALEHMSQLVGIAVTRGVVLKGVQSLAILDLMILPEYSKGVKTLHQGCRRLARQLRKDVVVCMSSAKWAKQYKFLGSFYFPTPAVFSLIIKKLDPSISEEVVYDGNAWHMFWIDSDDL